MSSAQRTTTTPTPMNRDTKSWGRRLSSNRTPSTQVPTTDRARRAPAKTRGRWLAVQLAVSGMFAAEEVGSSTSCTASIASTSSTREWWSRAFCSGISVAATGARCLPADGATERPGGDQLVERVEGGRVAHDRLALSGLVAAAVSHWWIPLYLRTCAVASTVWIDRASVCRECPVVVFRPINGLCRTRPDFWCYRTVCENCARRGPGSSQRSPGPGARRPAGSSRPSGSRRRRTPR